MKPLFHLDNSVEQSMFGVQKMREMIPRLYGGVGRGLLILGFGEHFLIIRRVLFISGLQKQLKIRSALSKRLLF
jgi:hypothetical protein